MHSKIYLDDKVPNTERRFGQAPEYYPVMIVTGSRRFPAMFTPAQISEAMERAAGNPEDIPKPGLWQRFKTWLTAH